MVCASAQAGVTRDSHGNVGFDTAAECDAAVAGGKVRFYQPHTHHPALRQAGEAELKTLRLRDLAQAETLAQQLGFRSADYANGACDQGVGRSQGRDGVSGELVGKFIPYSPDMPVNVYFDAQGRPVRATMQQCDNHFGGRLPRPVPGVTAASVATECFATVLVPARFETRTERVVKLAAAKRFEPVPATYKTVTEKVEVTPERKELKVIPATFKTVDDEIVVTPATTKVEVVPATFKTEDEQVMVKPESVRYEPLTLPLRAESVEEEKRAASTRLEVVPAAYKTVTEQVLVREATERVEVVPAVYETVTERVKVAEATREWKRGRAWIGQALEVKPVRGFIPTAAGTVNGARVDAQWQTLDTNTVDDDVMCLVEVPAQYETITRQVLKTPETLRKVPVPAEYATVTRQVLVSAATTREVEVPGTLQRVQRQVIDVERLRTAGFRFNDKGDLVATPTGERVLRAAAIAGEAGESEGAESGAEAYVKEVRVPAQYRTVSRQVQVQPATA